MDKANMTVKDWDAHYTEVPDAPDRAPIYKLLLPLVERPPGSILDVGCGTGVGLAAFGRHFPDAHLFGIDYSVRAREICKAQSPHIHFLVQDAVEHTFPLDFDLVLCVQTLEHFYGWEGAIVLSRILYVARQQAIISVPYKDMVPSADHKQTFHEHSFDKLHPTKVTQVSRYHMAVSWVMEGGQHALTANL